MPVINQLERKIGMMQGLDPVLENIVQDLNVVTDFRSMDYLNNVWDANNAYRYGTIENSDNGMPVFPAMVPVHPALAGFIHP